MIKPQDIMIALKICLYEPTSSCADKALTLGMSASEVHAAERRLSDARLLNPIDKTIQKKAFLNFLVHGLPYAFALNPKEMTRGMATAWAAPALADRGEGDYYASHDLEDFITVIDGRTAIVEEINCAPESLRNNLIRSIQLLNVNEDFLEALPGHLPPDTASQLRLPQLKQKLKDIAALNII
jgi:hypothetical protein